MDTLNCLIPNLYILRCFGVLPFKKQQSLLRLRTSSPLKSFFTLLSIICLTGICYEIYKEFQKINNLNNTNLNKKIEYLIMCVLLFLSLTFITGLSAIYFFNNSVEFLNKFVRKVNSNTLFSCVVTSSKVYRIERWYIIIFLTFEIATSSVVFYAFKKSIFTVYFARMLIVNTEHFGSLLSIILYHRFKFINESIPNLPKPLFYTSNKKINNFKNFSSLRLKYLKNYYKSLVDALQLVQEQFSVFWLLDLAQLSCAAVTFFAYIMISYQNQTLQIYTFAYLFIIINSIVRLVFITCTCGFACEEVSLILFLLFL